MPAKKSAPAAAAAAAPAPAPVVVSAPVEAPAPVAEKKTRGRKKKEEEVAAPASETEDAASSSSDEEAVIHPVDDLVLATQILDGLNKNAKKIDFSNIALYEAHSNFLKAFQRFETHMEIGRNKHMKASLKILHKAEEATAKKEAKKEAKKSKKDSKSSEESGEDATPKESGVNKPEDIVPEVLAFMGHPENTKLSRADLMEFFNKSRTELNKFAMDAEGKPLKGKPFYINEGKIGGFMTAIIASIKRRNLTAKAIEKGVLDSSGNPPEYVPYTYAMRVTPFCIDRHE